MVLKSAWDKVSGFNLTEADLLQMSLWGGDKSFIERTTKPRTSPYSQDSEEKKEKEDFDQLVMQIILTTQDRINALNDRIQALLNKIRQQEATFRKQAQEQQEQIDENSFKMQQMSEDIDFINEIIEEVKNNDGKFENAQDRDEFIEILRRNNLEIPDNLNTPNLIEQGEELIKQLSQNRKTLSEYNDKLEEIRNKLIQEADLLRDNAKCIEKDWNTRIKNLPPEEQVKELQKMADELEGLGKDSLQRVKELTQNEELTKAADKASYFNFDMKIEVSKFTM